MCGRDTQLFTWKQVHDFANLGGLLTPEADPEPNWNRAPTQQGWAIAADEGGGTAMPMRWGLLPPWAKDTRLAYKTINARLETVATKPAFRSAWKQRRALIPSSGYYEWMQLDARTKQPYYVQMQGAPVMFYAGLWESRRDEAGHELLTYSIITRDADQTVATLHDRMPLVLPPGAHADWLHGTAEQAMDIALSVPSAPLVFHPVSRDVGNPRNNAPHLVDAITLEGGTSA
jgi:putative SOS response-associated peptidase YedK